MLTDDQNRTGMDFSRYILYFLSLYGDDSSDFIERVVTQNETWVRDEMHSKQSLTEKNALPRTFFANS